MLDTKTGVRDDPGGGGKVHDRRRRYLDALSKSITIDPEGRTQSREGRSS